MRRRRGNIEGAAKSLDPGERKALGSAVRLTLSWTACARDRLFFAPHPYGAAGHLPFSAAMRSATRERSTLGATGFSRWGRPLARNARERSVKAPPVR